MNPQMSPQHAVTERLVEAARAVETRLTALLPPIDQRWSRSENEGVAPRRLSEAMAHGVLGGGKRFRPFLVIESAKLFGVPLELALNTAASLECLHCYSLVHDDLPAMDNDDLRRGRPTVHRAFDDWTAILAGDGLLTLAFEILARAETHLKPAVRCELVLELARAAGANGMVGGQAIDLEADKLGLPVQPDAAHIARLQAMKTGALITFGVMAGAILGEASARERAALRSYGDHLGLAFQIADDLLDAEGDATVMGKAVGKDAQAGKATLVSLMGTEAARLELVRVRDAAITALAPFGDRAETLIGAAHFVCARAS